MSPQTVKHVRWTKSRNLAISRSTGDVLIMVDDDTDFSQRLADAGAKNIFEPEITAVHRNVTSGGRCLGKLDDYVPADAESWAVQIYFWRKILFPWDRRGQIGRLFRGVFLRRDFLSHPNSLLVAAREMVRGWNIAVRQLAEGPSHHATLFVTAGD